MTILPLWAVGIMLGVFFYRHSSDIQSLRMLPELFESNGRLIKTMSTVTNELQQLRGNVDHMKLQLKDKGLLLLNDEPKQFGDVTYTNPQ